MQDQRTAGHGRMGRPNQIANFFQYEYIRLTNRCIDFNCESECTACPQSCVPKRLMAHGGDISQQGPQF